jgi:ankyrin repeat protein
LKGKYTGDIFMRISKGIFTITFLFVSIVISHSWSAASQCDLVDAAEKGNLEAIKSCLENGADVNGHELFTRTTALIEAAKNGHADCVKVLLHAKDVDVDAKDKNGYTALIISAEKGFANIVTQLLAKGADVNEKTNGGVTALWIATHEGHHDIVNILKAAGARVD